MKITANQLRKIIKEEIENLTEATSFGAALEAGSLDGVGRATIMNSLVALSDADFKKLELAMRDAKIEKEKGTRGKAVAFAKTSMSPEAIAAKITKSLSNFNWDWMGDEFSEQQAALVDVLDEVIGPGTGEEFIELVAFANADPRKSSVYRKMAPAAAQRKQMDSVKKLQSIANQLMT